MRRAGTLTAATLIAATPIIGTGCVPQDKYDNLLTAKRATEEQLVRVEDERNTAQANLDTALAELSETRRAYNGLESDYSQLEGLVDDAVRSNDDLQNAVRALEFGPLPADVESALTELAMAYPEVLTFDAKVGMLRFASDFTFDLGSAELTEDARSTIAALARILNSDTASPFEARIVGHTDNVPIRRADTRQKHPTNVHLSVHRSISVRDALASEGIDPFRIQVAGYGQYRPVVTNQRGGAAGNRRVEIFLVPLPEEQSVAAPVEVDVVEDYDEPMK